MELSDKVKRYVEISKICTAQFLLEHEDECDRLCDESRQLKDAMTLEELQSIKGNVSTPVFNWEIMPRIIAMQKQLEEKNGNQ